MSRLAQAVFGALGLSGTGTDLNQKVEIRVEKAGRGRKPTTGRFNTRAELCEWVWRQHLNTPANSSDIAVQCRVSQPTVSKIIATGEGRPDPQESNP